jgi:phosphoribosylaminoimidazole carboxylase
VTFTTRRMSQYQEDQKESVLKKGDRLEKLGWESYLNSSN